ncbi:MAG: hypothetical protein ACJAVI_003158 [Candidatus Azotimanducaceae bacterium]|jgi:hypothetical protein
MDDNDIKDAEQNEERDRIIRAQNDIDMYTGYDGNDAELYSMLQELNAPLHVPAHIALSRIFGDTPFVEPISGDEFSFDDVSYLENYQIDYHNAVVERRSAEVIRDFKTKFDKAKIYLKHRSNVSNAFYKEVGEIRAGRSNKNHILLAADVDANKPIEQTELITSSVADWALKNADVAITEWGAAKPKSKTSHSTELLEVLSAVISEFWENRDLNKPPIKKEAIMAWMKAKFPDLVDKKILSEKMLQSIDTIARPKH